MFDVPHVVDEEAARERELSPADEQAQEEKDERTEQGGGRVSAALA